MSQTPKYHLKVSSTFSRFPLLRQTPQGTGRWKDCQFHVHTPVEECDAWFIVDGLEQPEQTHCPANKVFFFASEPPDFKTYNQRWLEQFPQVATYNPCLRHPGRHQSPLGIHWFVDKSYDELCASGFPPKTKLLSVICSTKTTTAGHRRRLRFVERLRELVPMDVFGRGFTPIKDKWEGLADYRYSLAIENSAYHDYWSEKIADCFLTGTVPLYYGCPNINAYFAPESLIPIDIDPSRAEQTAEKIRSLISEADYQRRMPHLLAAKEQVLNEHNLFELLRQLDEKIKPEGGRKLVQFSPEPPLGYWHRQWLQWTRRFARFE